MLLKFVKKWKVIVCVSIIDDNFYFYFMSATTIRKSCFTELFHSFRCFSEDRLEEGIVHFDLFIQHAHMDAQLRDGEGKIYRRVWKAMGQPTPDSNPELSHPEFGRVVFRNLEGRSVPNGVRAKAIESFFMHFIRNELKKIAQAFQRGSPGSLFRDLFEFSSEIPFLQDAERLVYRMTWERLGKPTEETHPQIAHPDFGRLAFHRLENRSCTAQENADILHSVVRELDIRKWTDGVHQRARHFFERHSEFQPVDTRHITFGRGKEAELLTTLLNQYQGVCFGEGHGSPNTIRVLRTYMELFQRCGVRTLFMELIDTEMQADLDVFNRGGELTQELKKRCIDDHDRHFNTSIFEVMKLARTFGIQIVGIDSKCCKIRFSRFINQNRVLMMNYIAAKIMNREKGSDRFVALMGRGHLTNAKNTKSLTFPSQTEMHKILLDIDPNCNLEIVIEHSLFFLVHELLLKWPLPYIIQDRDVKIENVRSREIIDQFVELLRKKVKLKNCEDITYGVSELLHCPSIDLTISSFSGSWESRFHEQSTFYYYFETEANFRF